MGTGPIDFKPSTAFGAVVRGAGSIVATAGFTLNTPTRLAGALARGEGYRIPGTDSPPPLDLVGAWNALTSENAAKLAIDTAAELGKAWDAIGALVEGAGGAASAISKTA